MISASNCMEIFEQSVVDYHVHNNVDQPIKNPYPAHALEHLCYLKNWIDTVQWHLEDIIRDPNIDPVAGIELKRRIDRSNQHRTDVVEQIDDRIINHFAGITSPATAPLNSETPAWLLDRMSILVLKIYHMQEQTLRKDASSEHILKCNHKLSVLLEQRTDMIQCFDELLADVEAGRRKIKVYRQMKMYNDNDLNPVLYQQKSGR